MSTDELPTVDPGLRVALPSGGELLAEHGEKLWTVPAQGCAAQPISLVSFNFCDIISKEFLLRCLEAASEQGKRQELCLLLL